MYVMACKGKEAARKTLGKAARKPEAKKAKTRVTERGSGRPHPAAAVRSGNMSRQELEARVQKRTAQLAKAYDRLLFQIDERRRTEEVLTKKTYDLNQRVKEMNCLYSVYGLVAKAKLRFEEKLERIAELIPSAMQYPEAACARISFGGREYRTATFRDTGWKLRSEIMMDDRVVGDIAVVYLSEMHQEYEGPFLREEVALVAAIAKKIAETAEYVRAEEEVARYRSKLEALVATRTAELEKINEQLRREVEEHTRAEEMKSELVAELSDFAHIVSHDLKAPLRAISSLVTWLASDYADKFDTQGREQVALLVNRVKRMHNLIDAILQYSSVGRKDEERSEVDLNELLAGVIETVSPPPNITVAIKDKLPVLVSDGTRLQQVFQNLIGNAVKFMDKPEGEICVECIDDNSHYRFSVSDNGPGIEERYFERIFKIFQTLRARDEFESTGVGLAITRKIIEMYGGSLWVKSRVGHGSTFYFTFPKGVCGEKQ